MSCGTAVRVLPGVAGGGGGGGWKINEDVCSRVESESGQDEEKEHRTQQRVIVGHRCKRRSRQGTLWTRDSHASSARSEFEVMTFIEQCWLFSFHVGVAWENNSPKHVSRSYFHPFPKRRITGFNMPLNSIHANIPDNPYAHDIHSSVVKIKNRCD